MASRTLTPLTKQRRFHRTGTKLEVLSHLANYYCLAPKDLCKLLYGELTEANEASIRRTLRLLAAQNLIRYRSLPLTLSYGSAPHIWGLTAKGKENCEVLTVTPKEFKENEDARLLPHEYEISQFHLRLQGLCAQEGWKLHWQQADLKCTINPDAYFRISKGDKHWHYFLEVEKSKPNAVRADPSGRKKSGLTRKLEQYYDYYNTHKCEKEWNFPRFIVIILQRTSDRRSNLLETFPDKLRHKMFWLTSESSYKTDLDKDIFLTPKDHESRAYSFKDLQ